MKFITWWNMWQCSIQSPGLLATNSISRLRDGHQHGVARHPRAGLDPAPFGPGDEERQAVQVHRMVVDGPEVHDPDPDAFAQLADQGSDVGCGPAVDREEVELHRHRVRDGAAGQDGPFLDDQARSRDRPADRGQRGAE